MELATILVSLVAVTGIVWLWDKVYLAPKRSAIIANLPENAVDEVKDAAEHVPAWIDLPRSLFPIFLIVLLLRSFLVEPFRIPSGSMMPTLLIGDFILVNKFSYGLRLPVLNTKFLDVGEPQRGDVVVFRYPEDQTTPYIKRIIGLPGDTIEYNYIHKTLYINGDLISKNFTHIYQGLGQGSSMTSSEVYQESLGNEVAHNILLRPGAGHPIRYFWFNSKQDIVEIKTRAELATYGNPDLSKLKIQKIPEGHYFVLGDNRDNSRDSRFWGLVPEENLVGKAFFIWMNWDWSNGGINFPRLGTVIK